MANYPIEDIQGIADSHGEALRAAGIKDTDGLLGAAATRKGRETLAATTGLSATLLLTWANMADLYRIHGIGKQFAELLHASGVDTVTELKHRNPAHLAAKLLEVNEAEHRTRVVPDEKMLVDWIGQAQKLAPVIEY